MREQTTSKQHIVDIRCDHDGLKMAEIKNGHLILRSKHHGETHVKIVALGELGDAVGVRRSYLAGSESCR